jgi:hypothetical protein
VCREDDLVEPVAHEYALDLQEAGGDAKTHGKWLVTGD